MNMFLSRLQDYSIYIYSIYIYSMFIFTVIMIVIMISTLYYIIYCIYIYIYTPNFINLYWGWFMALGESHILLVTELTEIRIIRVISWRIKLMSGTGCRYESVLYHPSKLSTAEEEVFWTHNWQLSRRCIPPSSGMMPTMTSTVMVGITTLSVILGWFKSYEIAMFGGTKIH
jgi:hypothetical protein